MSKKKVRKIEKIYQDALRSINELSNEFPETQMKKTLNFLSNEHKNFELGVLKRCQLQQMEKGKFFEIGRIHSIDIWGFIFSFLDVRDLMSLYVVCVLFKNVIDTNSVAISNLNSVKESKKILFFKKFLLTRYDLIREIEFDKIFFSFLYQEKITLLGIKEMNFIHVGYETGLDQFFGLIFDVVPHFKHLVVCNRRYENNIGSFKTVSFHKKIVINENFQQIEGICGRSGNGVKNFFRPDTRKRGRRQFYQDDFSSSLILLSNIKKMHITVKTKKEVSQVLQTCTKLQEIKIHLGNKNQFHEETTGFNFDLPLLKKICFLFNWRKRNNDWGIGQYTDILNIPQACDLFCSILDSCSKYESLKKIGFNCESFAYINFNGFFYNRNSKENSRFINSVESLKSLRVFSFDYNCEERPFALKLKNLEKYRGVTGKLTNNILKRNRKTLKKIVISYGKYSDDFSRLLEKCKRIRKLKMRLNSYTNNIDIDYSKFKNLEFLFIDYCDSEVTSSRITNPSVLRIKIFGKVKNLLIDCCKLEELFVNSNFIQSINIKNNNLSVIEMKSLTNRWRNRSFNVNFEFLKSFNKLEINYLPRLICPFQYVNRLTIPFTQLYNVRKNLENVRSIVVKNDHGRIVNSVENKKIQEILLFCKNLHSIEFFPNFSKEQHEIEEYYEFPVVSRVKICGCANADKFLVFCRKSFPNLIELDIEINKKDKILHHFLKKERFTSLEKLVLKCKVIDQVNLRKILKKRKIKVLKVKRKYQGTFRILANIESEHLEKLSLGIYLVIDNRLILPKLKDLKFSCGENSSRNLEYLLENSPRNLKIVKILIPIGSNSNKYANEIKPFIAKFKGKNIKLIIKYKFFML